MFYEHDGRSQWPRGLYRSAAARMLRLWVRISPGPWMFICCVLSGRGPCDKLITRPEESYRLRCVVVCDLDTSCIRKPCPTGGCCSRYKQTNKHNGMSSIKLVIASQVRSVIQYKNLKPKFLKCNFNQWRSSTGKRAFVF
jgi:hypothetical protein